MLYPALCTPIYKETVWGGSRLREIYGRTIPSDKTGESWDIACREKEMSVIENGADAGQTLAQWFAADKPGTLGTLAAPMEEFPLLVKIIDARDNLSVQVHPSGAFLAGGENCASGERGKSEMWYVMQAPEGGELIIGLNAGVTRETLRFACETGEVEPCLHRLKVKRGDMVNIPAGLVHALTRGVMVAEVQQNSDTTYRLFDYNRAGLDGKPRVLHVEASLNAADFDNKIPKAVISGNVIENEFFRVEKIDVSGRQTFETDPRTFTLLTCVEGSCGEIPLSRTAFMPAGLGAYTITGACTLLKSSLPLGGKR